MNLGPKTAELLMVLESLSELLREVGDEAHWVNWFERDANCLRMGDFYGIEHFLRAFGGMGSISDLVLHPLNGHRIAEDEVSGTNKRLQELLGKGYELAREIARHA